MYKDDDFLRTNTVERKDTLRLYKNSTVGWKMRSNTLSVTSTTVFAVIVITPLKQSVLCRPLNKSGTNWPNLGTDMSREC